ncbi:MAG: hypothetical protein JWQ84_2332 [Mucilaginibacter sp.]|jgi:uncharacterized RDD family membrane protein YckC|nr:hypothetical protein [Mucilaginibacter sp.]MDB5017500.1 hypothetical protein [Mucilaginibacter sp.]MDB5139114.1 hypothetical protein [Mucilaginibacter sp.]
MDNAYYILEDGEQKGPFTFDELTEMELDIHTRVLSPSEDTWHDACDLPEFYPYFEAQGVHFPTEDNLASFWWRLLAFVIDFILLSFVINYTIIMLISRGVLSNILQNATMQSYSKMPVRDILILEFTVYSILFIYNFICEISPMKGSIGKKICRLVVVDVDGMPLTYTGALLRSFGKVISIFFYGAGFLSIFWSDHRQALHDYLAKTYVVKL